MQDVTAVTGFSGGTMLSYTGTDVGMGFSGAEFFALGGVYVANGLGIVDSLAFGSESGDTNSLIECAERLSSVEFQNALSEARNVNQNLGTAALRAKIYTELYGENEHFNGSNDLLALEYIRALKRVESEIVPIAHKRIGEVYNSEELTEICSATAIRRVLSPEISDFSRRDLSRYMPKPSYDILMRELEAERIYTLSRLDTAALALLRTRKPEVFSEIMEASGGVENRLTSLANECRTIEELVASAKDKRYSESRIRRLLIASILGITMRDVEVPPEFTTVLAANSRGRELLALARKRASIDVLSKTSASKSPIRDAIKVFRYSLGLKFHTF